MTVMTLERAKEHLDAWYKAELAVSTGQSYKIGSRQLTRANLLEIQKQINYWENRIAVLSGKNHRVKRVIPRDF